jgi:glutaredoxin-like protein
MALLSEQDRRTVQGHLAGLTHQVTLLFFTQTFGAPESALIARQVLGELAGLSDLVTIEEANFVLDKERAAQFGIADIPAVVLLRDGQDTRMRFLGAPAGYEFMSLVDAVRLAGSDDSGLSAASKALIAERVTAPLDIQVFVTPTCPHCPRAVTLAHRMATENPLITATCVEATEFPELSRKFRVTGVPKTVANGVELLGALPEEMFVSSIVRPELPEGDAPAQ